MPDAKGDCFYVHANMMLNDDDGYTLVHGVVSGQKSLKGVRYSHCWLEKDGMVIDKSNGNDICIPAFVYYTLGRINNENNGLKKYSHKEMRKMMVEHMHYGPWELDCKL